MRKNNFSVRIAAITVIAAMGAGIAWIPARSVDRSSVAPQAATDTCNCYKATPAAPLEVDLSDIVDSICRNPIMGNGEYGLLRRFAARNDGCGRVIPSIINFPFGGGGIQLRQPQIKE
jgi:hypothetical protein